MAGIWAPQQDVKRRLFNAFVLDTAVAEFHVPVQSFLDMLGQSAGLVDLGVLHQVVEDRFQIADIFSGGRIFTCRHPNGVIIRGQVQKIGLQSVGIGVAMGIGMQ